MVQVAVGTEKVTLNKAQEKGPFWASPNTCTPRRLCQPPPKTKNGLYLGLGGSKTDSEGTQSTCNPQLFVVCKPCNCHLRHLDPCSAPGKHSPTAHYTLQIAKPNCLLAFHFW